MLNFLNYVPKISPCSEVGIKTEVFADLNSCPTAQFIVQYIHAWQPHLLYSIMELNKKLKISIILQIFFQLFLQDRYLSTKSAP